MIHKEGYTILIVTVLVIVTLNIVFWYFIPSGIIKNILQLASLIVFFLILQFFRNPKRNTNANDFEIIAPVDGKVVISEVVFQEEYFKDKRYQVSIFMSPINVHVTRYPTTGKVIYSKYHPGKFLVAWHPKSSLLNERTSIVVQEEHTHQEVMYKQIAGLLARRIVNYAEIGQEVKVGTDAGFIKFGSRVDILLPLGTEIKAELNQTVRGGETVIAVLNNN